MTADCQRDQPPPPAAQPPAAGLDNYLRDGCGNHSSMRLMLLIAMVAGIAFGFLGVFLNSNSAVDLAIWLWGFAFTGKVAQRYTETAQGCK